MIDRVRSLISPAILATLLLTGCVLQDPYRAVLVEDGVARPCADEQLPANPLFLPCPMAVDLAVNMLELLPGTASAVEFHRGELCPPNARCRLQNDRGIVVVWFEGVPPLVVRVTPDFVGGFVAQPPESPPPWLVDQGPAQL